LLGPIANLPTFEEEALSMIFQNLNPFELQVASENNNGKNPFYDEKGNILCHQ
jgi:hypothetical protein